MRIFSSSVDSSQAKATFKKGMLWINIPKKDGKKNHSREIQIEKGSFPVL
ncbi:MULTISPECIES: Hsp20/alpha crystallin family protein [Legionella]|nr:MULTISPECIES: Hsp20/alpha crystallin family protein [Legionella]